MGAGAVQRMDDIHVQAPPEGSDFGHDSTPHPSSSDTHLLLSLLAVLLGHAHSRTIGPPGASV